MDKLDLINEIYRTVFSTLKEYDNSITIYNYELNRFKKTNIICELTFNAKEKIMKEIHTYENEKNAKEKADKFKLIEKFTKNKYPNWVKKQKLIDEYIECLEKLNILNSELYNLTELYEEQYMIDFNHELFNIFKNKLGYYTKLRNKIMDLCTRP